MQQQRQQGRIGWQCPRRHQPERPQDTSWASPRDSHHSQARFSLQRVFEVKYISSVVVFTGEKLKIRRLWATSVANRRFTHSRHGSHRIPARIPCCRRRFGRWTRREVEGSASCVLRAGALYAQAWWQRCRRHLATNINGAHGHVDARGAAGGGQTSSSSLTCGVRQAVQVRGAPTAGFRWLLPAQSTRHPPRAATGCLARSLRPVASATPHRCSHWRCLTSVSRACVACVAAAISKWARAPCSCTSGCTGVRASWRCRRCSKSTALPLRWRSP